MYGKRSGKKEEDILVIQGSHEPIVSEELWEQVQKKRKAVSIRFKKVDEPERISILSGLVKCPLCGRGLIASKTSM